jgi:hypothetical protein
MVQRFIENVPTAEPAHFSIATRSREGNNDPDYPGTALPIAFCPYPFYC